MQPCLRPQPSSPSHLSPTLTSSQAPELPRKAAGWGHWLCQHHLLSKIRVSRTPERCCNDLPLPAGCSHWQDAFGHMEILSPLSVLMQIILWRNLSPKKIAQCDGLVSSSTSRASLTSTSLARASWSCRSDPHPSILLAEICANLD